MSSVTNMNRMFWGASALNQDIADVIKAVMRERARFDRKCMILVRMGGWRREGTCIHPTSEFARAILHTLQQVRQTCVPAQTGGTANGSLVDEKKEKSDHSVVRRVSASDQPSCYKPTNCDAQPFNRAVTSRTELSKSRPTVLLQADQPCHQKSKP